MPLARKITSILDFKKSDLIELFELARQGKKLFKNNQDLLKNKVLGSFFFEPSTRTRMSFSSAFVRLGGSVIGTSSIEETRSGSEYQESLEDMARLMSEYCECAIMRSTNINHIKSFGDEVFIPFISAGHGPTPGPIDGLKMQQRYLSEHPTQALTDLFTLSQLFGDLRRVSEVLIIGNGRSINSFRLGLSNWPSIKIHMVPLDESLSAPENPRQPILNQEFYYNSIDELLDRPELDKIQVIYSSHASPIIDLDFMTHFSKDVILLDPMPRLAISKEVDTLHNSKYFYQASNSLYTRGALFVKLFGGT